MIASVHNPDTYMVALRQLVAQSKKRLGFLVGAGAPAGLYESGKDVPVIPAVAGLSTQVLKALDDNYGAALKELTSDLGQSNIEQILSRVRSLAAVLGSTEIHGLNGAGYSNLASAMCEEIGKIVAQPLPKEENAYTQLVNWISGIDRNHPVEIFTTNYDQLFEQALERMSVPYFDGFSGAKEPFFDPSTVSTNDLPPRWVRLWKLHGSLGWGTNEKGEVIRTPGSKATHMIFPEHLKYDQTQKAPYSALFDRLRDFLLTPDTLLVSIGFSFADAHISARITECLAANPTASVFAFQFKELAEEHHARDIAIRRSNMSVYAKDEAMINGIAAPWQPGDLPSKDWSAIRRSYWDVAPGMNQETFLLGRFDYFARFFASARASQANFLAPSAANQPEAI